MKYEFDIDICPLCGSKILPPENSTKTWICPTKFTDYTVATSHYIVTHLVTISIQTVLIDSFRITTYSDDYKTYINYIKEHKLIMVIPQLRIDKQADLLERIKRLMVFS